MRIGRKRVDPPRVASPEVGDAAIGNSGASRRGLMLKWAIGGRNYLEASCVDPVSYSKRFVGFMDRIST